LFVFNNLRAVLIEPMFRLERDKNEEKSDRQKSKDAAKSWGSEKSDDGGDCFVRARLQSCRTCRKINPASAAEGMPPVLSLKWRVQGL
jgi:hypothetical protein